MNQNNIDPHEILEVTPGATRPEIERAYYLARLAYGSESLASYSLYSPREKAEILERIERAYQILTNREDQPEEEKEALPRVSAVSETPVGRDPSPDEAATSQPPPRPLPRGRVPLRPISSLQKVEASDVPRPYDALALRKVRESRGVDLRDVSLRTKISLKNLRSIESGGYEDLPPNVYLKGYLAEYARCLRLNPVHVTEDFLEAAGAAAREEHGASGKHE